MEDLLKYKGYRASIRYSEEDGCFVGDVLGIDDIIAFDGQNIQELQAMFQESIDDYLENCAAWGKKPEKEYRGSFNVRVTPETHKSAALRAEELGISLNQFVAEAIRDKLEPKQSTYRIPEENLVVAEEPVAYTAGNAAKKCAESELETLKAAQLILEKYIRQAAQK